MAIGGRRATIDPEHNVYGSDNTEPELLANNNSAV